MIYRSVRRDGGQWCVPSPTAELDRFWDDFSHQYAPCMSAISNVLAKHADREKVMIDIGAWVGPVTLMASQHYGIVIAVEPNPAAYDLLNRTINSPQNGDLGQRVAPFQFAIACEDGPMRMVSTVDFYPLAGLEIDACVTTQAITIDRLMSLVDLHEKPIGLIKADVGTFHMASLVIPSLLQSAVEHRCPLVLSFNQSQHIAYEFGRIVQQVNEYIGTCIVPAESWNWGIRMHADDWSTLIEVYQK